MSISLQYAYSFGVFLIAFPIWLTLFLWKKEFRKEILLSSLVFGIVAFWTEPIFIKDYWSPGYIKAFYFGATQLGSLEDYFYGFFIGGIVSVIYEELFGKKFLLKKDKSRRWIWFLIPFYIVGSIIFLVPTFIFKVNSMYSATAVSVFSILFYTWYRKDLLGNSLFSGFFIGTLSVACLFLLNTIFPNLFYLHWKLHNLSGLFMFGVPVEEFLNGFIIGAVGGPFYEFFTGLKFKKS